MGFGIFIVLDLVGFGFFLVSVFKIFFGLRVILYLMGKLDRGKGGKWLRIF